MLMFPSGNIHPCKKTQLLKHIWYDGYVLIKKFSIYNILWSPILWWTNSHGLLRRRDVVHVLPDVVAGWRVVRHHHHLQTVKRSVFSKSEVQISKYLGRGLIEYCQTVLVSCPTRLSSREQRNIAQWCAKSMLLVYLCKRRPTLLFLSVAYY